MNRKMKISSTTGLALIVLLLSHQTRKNNSKKHADEKASPPAEVAAAVTGAPSTAGITTTTTANESLPDFDSHFEISHKKDDLIVVNVTKNAKRPPTSYSHAICDDGELLPIERVAIDPRRYVSDDEILDTYRLPKDTKSRGVCILLRDIDAKSYKKIGLSHDPSRPARDCTPEEKAKVSKGEGADPVELRWCQVQPISESYSFLQAITRSGKVCNSQLFFADAKSSRQLDDDEGRFGVDSDDKDDPKVTTCVFQGGDGPIDEAQIIAVSGTRDIPLMFELGGQSYYLLESTGNEGSAYYLRQLSPAGDKDRVEYFDYFWSGSFWKEEEALTNE